MQDDIEINADTGAAPTAHTKETMPSLEEMLKPKTCAAALQTTSTRRASSR